MTARNLRITDFDYPLPEEKIAKYPLAERDQSRLLILKNDTLSEDIFSHIPQYLPAHSIIVFNNTKVVHARLLFQKPTGAHIEVFCLEPDDRYPDITTALSQTENVYWKCLVGNAAAWTPDLTLEKRTGNHTILAKIVSRQTDHFIIHLSWTPSQTTFAEMLNEAGAVPLPPYIRRKPERTDDERYQTIYAHYPGSVAAPTAGLHFTQQVIDRLSEKNITRDYVTLHVGAGTFKPVKSSVIAEHEMHAEFIELHRSLIERLLENITRPVIAVGTTSLRTLESIYWIGVKIHEDPSISIQDLHISQWQPYDAPSTLPVEVSLQAIKAWMISHNIETLITKTSLMIVPSYSFRIASILITNFHQPKSTLLLLVAAFVGEKWKSAYAYALENDFRFLSYGDSCLFFRQ